MTSLVPQNTDKNLSASTLEGALRRLHTRKAVSAPESPSEALKPVSLRKGTQEAISRLSGELGAVQLPSKPRRLTDTELALMEKAGTDAKLVKASLEGVVDAIKGAFFNHLDIGLAEEDAEAVAHLWDEKSKHYLVKGEQEIEGSGKKFVRQLQEGAPTIDAADLKRLYEEGKITRAQYYKITRKPDVPRVVDEDALLEALADTELADTIKTVIKSGKVTASFWIRDIGEDD